MKFERIDNNHVKFTFTITPDEFDHALQHAYRHIQDEVELKGFRKGKVSFNVYAQKVGLEGLYPDALNHAIGHKFDEALMIEEFVIVSEPSKVDIDFSKVSRTNPFEVSFVVAIKPEVKLGQYKGIEIPNVDTLVSNEEIDEEINRLLSMNATVEPKQEGNLENGDIAIFDFEGFKDGVPFEGGKAENYELKIGSKQFIPGFEDGMIGMAMGEEREINVTFPENYHSEELAGQPAVFKVKLHEIKVTKTSDLNDAWVETLNRDNIKTVDELKASIKNDIKSRKEQNARNEKIENALAKVVETATIDVPQEMFDQEIENFKRSVENQAKQYQLDLQTFITLSGLTEEEFEKQAQEASKRRVLQSLVIEEIAKVEGFTATEEEINNKYNELSEMYKMPVDEIKKYINDRLVINDITFEKALNFVVDNAKLV